MNKNTYIKLTAENAKETAENILKDYPKQINLHERDFLTIIDRGAKYIECNQFNIIEPTMEVGKHYKEIENSYFPDIKNIEVDFQSVEPVKTKDERRKRIDHIFAIIDFEIDPEKLTKIIQVIDHDNEYKEKSTYEMYIKLK